ncbi:MAG: hypothetical protein S0880_03150, partial [Actinomycetota bacterium]|nr:hypothetical protein [Actinomycetota bacterium]
MIDKGTFKRLVAPAAVGAIGLVALGSVGAAGQFLLRLSTGGATTQALQEVPELPADADLVAEWAPDAWDGERALEPATRRRIEAAYVRAIGALGRYGATGDASGIEDNFAGPAMRAAIELPMQEATALWSVSHRLRLDLYSLDGRTAVITDTAAEIVRSTRSGDRDTLISVTERYEVVLVLEEGTWLVRQLRRVAGDAPVIVSRGTDADGRATTLVDGLEPAPASGPVPRLRGAGYRPAAAPFELQWATFDAGRARADLGRLAALGLDSVRAHLPFAAIGGAEPNADALDDLRTFLDLADEHGLGVVLTLFDDRTDHTPNSWTADDHHLRAVAAAVGDHPALVMWDLGDSPDLATATASPAEIRARLVHLVSTLRAADPITPITITWSSPEVAADPGMARFVDAVSFRWSGDAHGLADAVAGLRAVVGGRPLIVGAYGTHSWDGPLPNGRTEDDQAEATAAVLRTIRELDLAGAFARSLYDLAVAPGGSPIPRPWVSGPATHIGLLR